MKTRAVFFPFDLFGSNGARAGAELLADAFKEMLADNRREKVPTRARAYTGKTSVEEFAFDALDDYRGWREEARRTAAAAFESGDRLLWVAGNHLGVLPVYEALGPDALVIQFDAHLDIFDLSDCAETLSHGNFLLHAEKPLPAIVNVGHRELLLKPDYIDRFYKANLSATELAADETAGVERLIQWCAGYERIFVDIDCDAFDPAYFPACSHPQPFGLSTRTLLRCLEAIWSKKIVGLGLSEFEPASDRRDQGLRTLVWLMEYALLKIHERG